MINQPIYQKWKRRIISIPVIISVWFVVTVLFPVLLLINGLADLFSRQRKLYPRVRGISFFLLYLNCEVCGVILSFAGWLFSGVWLGLNKKRFLSFNISLQRWWSNTIFRGAFFIFSMPLKIQGESCISPGPILLLPRHASTADTIFPSALVANKHNLLLRYVLKKELLWDVCLDVVGQRLKNVFVDRKSKNPGAEIADIKTLSTNLSAEEGIIIYPEGTRFHQKKLKKKLADLKNSNKQELFERASSLKFVLPPKLGGVLAILEASPDMDVVFCAHSGFEDAESFLQFWRGGLIHKRVTVRFWRVSSSDIPKKRDEQSIWLYEEWLKMDRIVQELSVANKYN